MSNREACISIIDGFGEENLGGVLNTLKSMKDMFDKAIEDAMDEAYCQKLYQDYLDDPDPEKDDEISLEDLAEELGIAV